MWAGIRKIPVLQVIVIMIFDWFSIYILWEGPESIEVDFVTEPSSQRVHEESCAGSFDEHLVRQPITRKQGKHKTEAHLIRRRSFVSASVSHTTQSH